MSGMKQRYEVLDAWRGIAAVMVVLFHYAFLFSDRFGKFPFIHNSYLFVDFFFVLSGFVIAHTYQSRIFKKEISLKRFIWRRFLRLWPLHIVTMGLMIGLKAMQSSFAETFSWITLFHQVFLLHAVVFSDDFVQWNLASWSISAEFYTYLLFFFVFLYNKRPNKIVLSLVSGAICIFLLLFNNQGPHMLYMDAAGKFGLFRCVAGFSIGVVLYNLRESIKKRLEGRDLSLYEILILFIIMIFIHMLGRGFTSVMSPFIFFIFVAVFSMQSGMISRFLLTKPFQVLGTLSYSIYMTHMFVMDVCGQLFPHGWWLLPISFLALFCFSYLTHEYVEAPFYKPRKLRHMVQQ